MKGMLSIALGMLMVTSAFAAFAWPAASGQQAGFQVQADEPAIAMATAPFRIDSNGDFSSYAASGSGTDIDPWIIENLVVDGTGAGYGIYIGNTSQYFVLRNCTVGNASGGSAGADVYYPDAGLVFVNVARGTVENCTFRDNSYCGALLSTSVRRNTFDLCSFIDNGAAGIDAADINNNDFSNLTVTGNQEAGIVFVESPNNSLTFSNVSDNAGDGIELTACNNNHIQNNTFSSNGGNGIWLGHNSTNGSTVNEFLGNEIEGNAANGIAIIGAFDLAVQTLNNTVAYNVITGNTLDGLYLAWATGCNMFENVFSSNQGRGAFLSFGADNLLYHNRFISNGIQAADMTSANFWNESYPTGGNYWSDYTGWDVMSGPLQDLLGSDGIGDTDYMIDSDTTDHYPLWVPADIDYIRMMDGPNGTGNPAPAKVYTYPWFNITLWAAGFNTTHGYVRDLWANWTNSNYSGAQSDITNATGYSTTWQAGPSEGAALLTAENGTGLSCDVNVTIATYIPDLIIDGRTDDLIEDPPVTQISWKNITQGGSASYSVVAENDGPTAASMTLVWDVSGLPGTWYATMLDDDTHSNVTASMATGFSFVLQPGARENFTLYINATTMAGFGQMGAVNIGLFPPSGMQDSAGAIAQTYYPDFITLTESPNGAALAGEAMQVGGSLLAYASAYNSTGPTYLGIVPVDWSVAPALGTFDNATGTSSTFTANGTGTATVTGTSIGLGLSDTYGVTITAATVLPDSSVTDAGGYWHNTSPADIGAEAAEGDYPVANLTLWFRYSADNATWGNWTAFSTDAAAPWAWSFGFPNGTGYYGFYSIAIDTMSNEELAASGTDAECAFDDVPPTIEDGSGTSATTGETFTVTASVHDNMALHGAHLIYWFGSGTEFNVTMTGTGNTKTYAVPIPPDSLDALHYRIAAVDRARNWNSTQVADVTVLDNDAPTADAGPDQTVDAGAPAVFNGTASQDNIGIANYTWTFTHNGTSEELWGAEPSFTFPLPGVFQVTLTVADAAGNTASDQMEATVLRVPVQPEADAGADQSSYAGDTVQFDGTGSTDDMGIVNYTWTFIHNGTSATLWGSEPQFTFWTPGTYNVTLTVTDYDGLTASDIVQVAVEPAPGDGALLSDLCIVMLVICLLLALLLLLLLLRRRKKNEAQGVQPSDAATQGQGGSQAASPDMEEQAPRETPPSYKYP